MNAGEWVAAAVGCTVLLTAVGHLIRLMYRAARTWETLAADVSDLKRQFNNGFRADIREAKENSAEAVRLAGTAAARVGVIESRQEDIQRAMNALRAEVDVYTNVVIDDRHQLRRQIREAGIHLDDTA